MTWRRFAQAWNSVVLALRRGALVSDAERDARLATLSDEASGARLGSRARLAPRDAAKSGGGAHAP